MLVMTTLSQLSTSFFCLSSFHDQTLKRPRNAHSPPCSKMAPFGQRRCKLRVFDEKWSSFAVEEGKDGIFLGEEGLGRKVKGRVVLVRSNQGFGFNGGGGGDGRDNSGTVRLLGNIALAVGLTYLSITGQLGLVFDAVGWVLDAVSWVVDALISLSLLVVLIPILGLGAFFWWAGRDILQGTCPNCGNEFQIFKSTVNDELQLCPFCSQPFRVVGDEFVGDAGKFSKESSTFGQAFSDFYAGSSKGKNSSSAVVDVDAEVKDAD